MKKVLSLVLVTMMSTSLLVGCGKKDAAQPSQTPATTPTATETPLATTTPTDTPAATTTPTEAPTANAGLTDDLTTIINKIYENKNVALKLATNPVDIKDANALSAFTGLKDASKIKEVVASEPMMGSQAYSLVLVRVNDSKDAEAVADEMKAGINPAKWICVIADNVKVAAYGDVVMLAMTSSELTDVATADELVSAFQTVCGGTLDVTK